MEEVPDFGPPQNIPAAVAKKLREAFGAATLEDAVAKAIAMANQPTNVPNTRTRRFEISGEAYYLSEYVGKLIDAEIGEPPAPQPPSLGVSQFVIDGITFYVQPPVADAVRKERTNAARLNVSQRDEARKEYDTLAEELEKVKLELKQEKALRKQADELAERSTRRLVEATEPGFIGAFAARDHAREQCAALKDHFESVHEVLTKFGAPAMEGSINLKPYQRIQKLGMVADAGEKWHKIVVECERILELQGTAESPAACALAVHVRDLREKCRSAVAKHEANIEKLNAVVAAVGLAAGGYESIREHFEKRALASSDGTNDFHKVHYPLLRDALKGVRDLA